MFHNELHNIVKKFIDSPVYQHIDLLPRKSFINEFCVLDMTLPRRVGKTTTVLNLCEMGDIIFTRNLGMMDHIGGELSKLDKGYPQIVVIANCKFSVNGGFANDLRSVIKRYTTSSTVLWFDETETDCLDFVKDYLIKETEIPIGFKLVSLQTR